MRWALLAALIVGGATPGKGQLSGEWSAEVALLPGPLLSSTVLSLTYAVPSWALTSMSEFSMFGGWVWQEFSISGGLSPLAVEGTVLFGPLIPDFLYAQAIVHLPMGGVEISVYTALLGAAVGGYVPGGPVGGAVAQARASLGNGTETKLTVGVGASLPEAGFTIYHVSGLKRTYATDPRPGGSAFTQATLSLTGLPFCCGIAGDARLSFTKGGLDNLELVVKGLPLCCGVSFDAAVKFTVPAKTVTLTPRWGGSGNACVALYGNAQWNEASSAFGGVEVYGWKVRCGVGDCSYVEFLTALDVAKVEEILGDLFQDEEFEYLKLGFCGPACCGGRYTVEIGVYFSASGPLFGIRRLAVGIALPVMANSSFTVGLTSAPTLDVGWKVAF